MNPPSETDLAEFAAVRDEVLAMGREAERIKVIEQMTRLVDEADARSRRRVD